ncbi:Uncharacterized protein APZ42_014620 [Daphnia magna]|uniref:Uncharacterized protein n=1 Tax=Daphnia magna TaxID=35525 RepID=A0A162PRS4_9CRUS|nr:Uncharacterized protein APZ42_014620 [Daphnia magna]
MYIYRIIFVTWSFILPFESLGHISLKQKTKIKTFEMRRAIRKNLPCVVDVSFELVHLTSKYLIFRVDGFWN